MAKYTVSGNDIVTRRSESDPTRWCRNVVNNSEAKCALNGTSTRESRIGCALLEGWPMGPQWRDPISGSPGEVAIRQWNWILRLSSRFHLFSSPFSHNSVCTPHRRHVFRISLTLWWLYLHGELPAWIPRGRFELKTTTCVTMDFNEFYFILFFIVIQLFLKYYSAIQLFGRKIISDDNHLPV